MKLSKLTNKQQEILKLLYRYRFLNRIQIQAMMNHKDYKTINLWLKDLREKQYLKWIYSTHFLEKTKPAIYYLGLNGIRFLKQQTTTGDDGEPYPTYPIDELRKRYRDNNRSESFRARSIVIADCCINLKAKSSQELRYGIATQADYANSDHGYHFLVDAETITPHLCIVKHEYKKNGVPDKNDPGIITNYLLEIFDPSFPHYRIRYRLKQYVNYLSNDEWESGDNDPSPIILLVCPRVTDLIYAKRRTKKILENEWDTEDIHLWFTTIDQLKQHGITALIWEEHRKIFAI